jgi:hypothetical protein
MDLSPKLLPVAALYVDPRGHYPSICLDVWCSDRDADQYPGPFPVVAHPPCGQWGSLRRLATPDPRTMESGPIAFSHVRRWGGVLEHPARSLLFRTCGAPGPGELPDSHGGWTLEILQGRFGHPAPKLTWLYIVGVGADALPPAPGPDTSFTRVESLSRRARRLTPSRMAIWLASVANSCGPGR